MASTAILTTNGNFSVDANETIPFGAVVRGFGSRCDCGPRITLNGTSLMLVGPGYYSLVCSASFVPTATGPVEIQFYQDGVELPGAVASSQGTASEAVNLFVVGFPRNFGDGGTSSITAKVSAAGQFTTFTTKVDKE